MLTVSTIFHDENHLLNASKKSFCWHISNRSFQILWLIVKSETEKIMKKRNRFILKTFRLLVFFDFAGDVLHDK